MKKVVVLLFILAGTLQVNAQLQVNPQFGLTFQNLSDDEAVVVNTNSTLESNFSADLGMMFGVDFRIGKAFYFQPGVFMSRNVTITKLVGDSVYTGNELKDKLVRTSLKLKGLLGYKLVNREGFKLRLVAGPTYDYLLSIDHTGEEIKWNKNDFNNGSFNLDGAFGVDVWFISAELGYSYGLTEAFDRQDDYNFNSRYSTFYISVGVIFGNGTKKNNNRSGNE